MVFRKLDAWTGWSSSLTQVYTLVLFGASPLFLDSSGYMRMTRAKFLFFSTLSCIYLGLLLLRYVSACIGHEVPPFSVRKLWTGSSLTSKLIVLFLLVACVSALCSPYKKTVWLGEARYNGLFTLLLLGGAFLAVSHFGSLHRAHIWVFGASSLLASALGMTQVAGKNPFALYPVGETFASLQFASTLGNIDFVATFFSMSIPFCAAAVIAGRTAKRYFLLAPMMAGMLLLWITGVAGGRVAVLGSLVLLLPLFVESRDRFKHFLLVAGGLLVSIFLSSLPSFSGEGSPHWALLIAAALACLGAFLVGALFAKRVFPGKAFAIGGAALLLCSAIFILTLALMQPEDGDTDRLLPALGAFLKGTAPDYVGHGRVGIWRRALEMAGDHLLIGTGPDSFAQAFAARFPEFIAETSGTALYDAAHNEYLQNLCLYGIPGAIAYLAFFISLIVRGYLAARGGNVASLPLLGGVLGYGIGAVFSLSFVGTAPIFFILCGLLEASVQEHRALLDRGRKRSQAAFAGL